MSSSPATLPPHQPLTEYYTHAASRPAFLQQLFDQTAPDYDRIEWLMSFGSGSWYRHQALLRAGLKPGMRIIDVATGTGLVARQEVRLAGDPRLILGLDPSPGMLSRALSSLGIQGARAMAEHLPLPSDSFDFLSMGYALRHVADVPTVFAEFFRVLKPGGRLCILEITRPASPLACRALQLYLRTFVPLLTRVATRRPANRRLWEYYWDTIAACIKPPAVLSSLDRAGFTHIRHQTQLGVFSEYTASKPQSNFPLPKTPASL